MITTPPETPSDRRRRLEAERMRRSRAKQRASGITQVTVVIPAHRGDDLRALALVWVAEHEAQVAPVEKMR
jgi:glyoxylase-like metal-dependent hydrolase (beta-lactamase superfamily II)